MITLVIVLLSLSISLASAALGAAVTTFFWQPKGLLQLVYVGTLFGFVTFLAVQHLFRKRDTYCPTRWYEFTRDALLGIGAMVSFWGGASFAFNAIVPPLLLALGFVLVTKACIIGPWQGWNAYLGPKPLLRRRTTLTSAKRRRAF